VDAVYGEVLEPWSGALHEVEQQVLDDEEIIIDPACSAGKIEVI
jgi:hypothetical protein